MEEVLDFINTTIREEKGSRVTIASKLIDSELDSFGYTVLFLELDEKYGYFSDIPVEVDPFSTIDFPTISVEEMITKCLSNNTTI